MIEIDRNSEMQNWYCFGRISLKLSAGVNFTLRVKRNEKNIEIWCRFIWGHGKKNTLHLNIKWVQKKTNSQMPFFRTAFLLTFSYFSVLLFSIKIKLSFLIENMELHRGKIRQDFDFKNWPHKRCLLWITEELSGQILMLGKTFLFGNHLLKISVVSSNPF